MKKLSCFMIIILIASIILISGCGEKPECKVKSDCLSGNKCEKVNCVEGKCKVTQTIDNCCGNGIEENIEDDKTGNSCTCPEDYGECSVPDDLDEEYFSAECTNKDNDGSICRIDMNTEMQSQISYSEDIKESYYQMKFGLNMPGPFNTKKDTIKITFTPVIMTDDIQDINIKTITFKAKIDESTAETDIIKERIERKIWNRADPLELEPLEIEIPIEYPFNDISNEITEMNAQIDYTYTEADGDIKTKTENIRRIVERRSPLTIITPNFNYTISDCPVCNDNNAGTRDYCDTANGNSYCIYEPISNRAGNHKCDANENKCTAPEDCGYCEGEYSDYLGYSCISQKCSVTISTSQAQKNIQKTEEKAGMSFQLDLLLNQPFDIEADSAELDMKIKQVEDYIIFPVEITYVVLKDNQDNVIANIDYSEENTISSTGETISFDYDFTNYYMEGMESEKTVEYTIGIKYTKIYHKTDGDEQQTETDEITGDFGKVIFVKQGEIS